MSDHAEFAQTSAVRAATTKSPALPDSVLMNERSGWDSWPRRSRAVARVCSGAPDAPSRRRRELRFTGRFAARAPVGGFKP
ncbi:hypothetical protein [Streptomyces bobili]|uniref:hypothetical protein n=1 Tax=Streptomyces bobili TaxID=67280 RepID=UPI0037B2E831